VRVLLHLAILVLTARMLAQSNTGELRLKVTDPHGLGARTAVQLISEANDFHAADFTTHESGVVVAKRLPFGLYRVQIEQSEFGAVGVPIKVRSAIPSNAPSS